MANMRFMFVALVLLACCVVELNARRRSPPPLKGQVNKYGRRHHRKSSVCEFGEQTYELDEMWKPDLGVPFGVMDCIQCECVPIQRKRRVVGRVKCRDIKRDCPKPSCKTPVLAKGQCCKTCYNSAAGNLSRARVQDEDEGKSGKEFAVLMTVSGAGDSGHWTNSTLSASLGGGGGLSASLGVGGGGGAAAGRLSLKGRVLTYSFFYQRMARPERVVFLDGDQNIVEELPVPPVEPSDYQLISSKVCGQWKKMPRQYRRLLKKERLQVAFASGPPTTDAEQVQLMVGGRVRRDKGLQTETFSGLLLPSDGSTWHGAAGTAIVSLSPVQRGAFHVSLVLQQPAATPSGPPAAAAQNPDGRRQLLVQMNVEGSVNLLLDELIEVDAGKSGEVVLEASTTLQPAELRHLSRGRIRLSVRSANGEHHVISCLLMPRLTCNTFTALLSGAGSLEDPAPATSALGVARLQLWNNGSLQFSVHLERMDAQVLAIQLAADDKRAFVVEDLLPHYIQSWSNGTLTRLNPRDITALLEEKLVLDVETDRHRSELRGRVLGLVSDEAHVDSQLFPITLHAHNSSSAGAVWLAVDTDCALHYDVQIVDRAGGGRRLELVELPRRQKHDRILTEFRGDRVENRIGHLPKTTLFRLSQGETILRVVPLQNGYQLTSEQVKVSVPKQCVPRRPGRVIGFFQDQSEYEDNEIRTSTECEYKGSVYGDGDQWDALHDSCTVCQCYRGRVRCHRIVCPTLQCTNQLRHPDSCCPVCHNVTVPTVDTVTVASLGCSLAGRFRPVGSVWHPYLPPMGFAKCVVCKCQMASNGSSASVACSSKPCPKLDCPGREFLPDAAACCKQCQVAPPPTQKTYIGGSTALARIPPGAMQDEARDISGMDLLLHGGCHRHGVYYSNGDTWHPRIATIGLLPCYTCRCRVGEISCYKEKCRKLSCSVTRHYRDQCCPVCVDAVLFHEKAKRRRRHSPP